MYKPHSWEWCEIQAQSRPSNHVLNNFGVCSAFFSVGWTFRQVLPTCLQVFISPVKIKTLSKLTPPYTLLLNLNMKGNLRKTIASWLMSLSIFMIPPLPLNPTSYSAYWSMAQTSQSMYKQLLKMVCCFVFPYLWYFFQLESPCTYSSP